MIDKMIDKMIDRIKPKIKPFLTASIAVVILLTCALALFPVDVKKIEIHRFDDFQQGELKGVVLDSKGRIAIGSGTKTIAGPAAEYILSLDMGANGDLYVGTGHKASVYRIRAKNPTPNAPADEIFASDALDVHALLVKSNGDIIAGTSPDGKLYKIPAASKDKKEAKEFFDPEEKFIWDLKEDHGGNIICATGSNSGVYRITPDGQSAKIFAPEDGHLISLFITADNAILAGSGDRGTLYRIDANRKVKVLYDTPFEEIRGICEDKNGNIYFSASRGASGFRPFVKAQSGADASKKKTESKLIEPANDKSALYCLRTDGVVDVIWKSPTEYIYSAIYDATNDGVLIGTGNSGRVYRVKKDGSFAIVVESDSAQVFKMINKNSQFTLATNNTASILQLDQTPGTKGTYFSDVYDLQVQSKVGRLYWEAETSPQSDISLFIRTGNTKTPDNTWTQWSAPFSDSENSAVNISDCRYIQLKAALNSKNTIDTPYLYGIKVYYVQANLTPSIKRIDIRKISPKPSLSVGKEDDKPKPAPSPSPLSKGLEITWQTEDLNNDKLKYDVYLKKTNAANWIPIKQDITENRLALDMSLFQDGKYTVKIEADDTLSNPPATAKSATLVSSPFIIDSTPPTLTNFSAMGTRVRFTAQDQMSIIADVSYSVDGKLWFPLFPVDGVNDSKSESYDVDLKGPGAKKIVFLRAQDDYDNSTVFQTELNTNPK
ncbi:MAG: hypothetical protein ACM3SY_17600 [Candidatus Omnitrophota bacterium]